MYFHQQKVRFNFEITPIGIRGYLGIIYDEHVNMGVEAFLTWLVTVNDLDTIFIKEEGLEAT